MRPKTTEPWHVYTLSDPRNGAVRYVGCSGDAERRLKGHCSEARRDEDKSPKSLWIRELMNESLLPVVKVIESGRGDSWYSAESRWTTHFLDEGCDLVNVRYAKIGPRLAAVIRQALAAGVAPASIARKCNVSRQTIGAIRDGKTW
jgi:hypothetical protein